MTMNPDLQAIVAEVVREAVAEMARTAPKGQAPSPVAEASAHETPGAQYVTSRQGRLRTESIRIANDRDLDQFARRLLEMFENPKHRADLRNGWLRFSLASAPPSTINLAGPSPGTGAAASARRVPKGAVTERDINAAAEAGQGLLLSRGAVLTPLAKERARALGVPVEKEKR